LNVFYLTLDKIQTFADGKFDLSNASPESVEQRYADMLTDAAERLEALTIRKPAQPSGEWTKRG
jgi:amphiphysin